MATKKKPTAAQRADERKRFKATRMRERERRCDSLYWHRRFTAPEICDTLIDEGLFEEKASPAAALKWTQERIKAIRAGADPEAVIRLQRPAETERYTQGLAKLLRDALDIIEDDAVVKREVVTPKGDVKTVSEPKVTESDRIKAIARAESILEKLALVATVNAKGKTTEADSDPSSRAKDERPPFQFNFSGKSITTLLSQRVDADTGNVN